LYVSVAVNCTQEERVSMKTVVIVNGHPRAGKDTAVDFLEVMLGEAGHNVMRYSSIDPVREALSHIGVDTSAKTEADRAVLVEVGMALQNAPLL